MRVLRRRGILIAGSIAAFGLMGLLYLAVATRVYTSSTSILVGANRISLTSDAQVALPSSDNLVESQVQIVKSEAIARRVVDKLGLDKDPQFNGTGPGRLVSYFNNGLRTFSDLMPAWADLTHYQVRQEPLIIDDNNRETFRRSAVQTLLGNLDVTRAPRSYVISISFRTFEPLKATLVANAIADAFLVDQLEVQYDQTKRAAGWLSSRLEEMRDRVEKSEREVEVYRANNELTLANGRLISDQQLQELDTQLTLARGRAAEAKAKLEQVKAIDVAGTDPAALPEVTNSEAINRLRSQYGEVLRTVADLSSRYGSAHPLVASAQSQLQNVKSLIDLEVQRIAESYSNEYQVAVARASSLAASFIDLRARNAAQSQAQVRLRELEREANSTRTIYERFLNRYKEMSGNESVPTPDARVLAAASVPLGPTSPNAVVAMILSLLAGAIIGVGTAFGIEFLHVGLRTRRQVEDAFGLPLISLVPMVRGRRQKDLSNYVAENPLTNYAEAIRAIRMAVHFAGDAKVVAVASALPAEGKSTTTLNLARYAANSGAKTLLIDADMRRPTVTKLACPSVTKGLAEVLRNEIPLEAALVQDPLNRSVTILPTARKDQPLYTAESLASPRMAELLAQARKTFDLIVIDVSPLIPVVDARALLNQVDKIVMVVEWNKTSRHVVKEALQLLDPWRENILGIVLNKTDMKRVHHYEHYNSKAYAQRFPDYYGSKR
jgi:capsular exopolysaccharide synthesis family protein